MARSKIVVGAGVICYVNGKPFGRATAFRWSVATPRRPHYGIDATEPQELMVTTTRVTGTVGLVRTVGDGGAEGAGMTTRLEDLSREKYFTLTLVERKSDTVIFEARYCSVTNQHWAAEAKNKVEGTVEFEGLDYSNELRPISHS